MKWAAQASPDQTDLGRARGIKRDHSTESEVTVYGLECLIGTKSSNQEKSQSTKKRR